MREMIVAAARNGVIGRDNRLLWHCKPDLKFFKETTLGKNCVMGANTARSLGRALPGRNNYVLTSGVAPYEDMYVIRTVEQVLDQLEDFIVIGGGKIYEAFLPHVERLYYTDINAAPFGDAHFPNINFATAAESGQLQAKLLKKGRARGDIQQPGYRIIQWDFPVGLMYADQPPSTESKIA